MAILKQGGENPYAGKVMTSMGIRDARPPLCMRCGGRKEDQLYTINGYGQQVCADCAGPKHAMALRTSCGDDPCTCLAAGRGNGSESSSS